MASSLFFQLGAFHGPTVLSSMLRDQPWDELTEHARKLVLSCLDSTGASGRLSGPDPANPGDGGVEHDARYSRWLRSICEEATPQAHVVHSQVSCGLEMAGGQLVVCQGGGGGHDRKVHGACAQDAVLLVGACTTGTPDNHKDRTLVPLRPAVAVASQGPDNGPGAGDFSVLHQGRELSGAHTVVQLAPRPHDPCRTWSSWGFGKYDGSLPEGLEDCAVCVYSGQVLVLGHPGGTPYAPLHQQPSVALSSSPHCHLWVLRPGGSSTTPRNPAADLVRFLPAAEPGDRPPSARGRHAMAVDPSSSRLWVFGGWKKGPGADSTQWRSSGQEQRQCRPADVEARCFWAQLPRPSTPAVAGAGGDAGETPRPEPLRWAQVVLRAGPCSRCAVAAKQPMATGPGTGPPFALAGAWPRQGPCGVPGCGSLPCPLHVGAMVACDGQLHVLSALEVKGPVRQERGEESGKRTAEADAPNGRCWRLHRVDCATGLCTLVAPAAVPTAAGEHQSPGSCDAAPAWTEDATAMADDFLPYMYVYGSCTAAGLAAPRFCATLHRLDLRTGAWGEVGTAGARLHAAAGAAGAASGGAVVLAGGVRDARKGPEARVQLVLPAMEQLSPAALRELGQQRGPEAARLAAAELAAREGSRLARLAMARRLRQVAPGEVLFAHPGDAAAAAAGGGGASCAAGARRPRPVRVLAAALALQSRGGMFDAEFWDMLEEGGDGGGGVCLPGHDPLAVAAAAAWVVGRQRVQPEWDTAFVASLLDVARLWEVPALVHECVGELALRVCSPPPVQPRATTQPQPPGAAAWGPPLAEVPRLLAAWDNVRRWGLLPREEGGGAGGEAAAGAPSDLDVQWLRWMGRQLSAAGLVPLMQSATAAGHGGSQALCRRRAQELLAMEQQPGRDPEAEGGVVLLFAAMFGDGEPCGPQADPSPPPPDLLLLRSLAWWDRRLRTRLREGPTIRRLAWLLSELQALDPGYTDDEEESPHGQESHHQHDQNFGAPGAGHTRQPPAATNSCQLSPPAKRAAGLIGTEGNGDKRQRCDTSASAATATGPAGPAGAGGRTAALGGEVGFKANGLQTGCAATCEGTEEEELPLARQLRGFLCEAVWRWARPTTAQALLQALQDAGAAIPDWLRQRLLELASASAGPTQPPTQQQGQGQAPLLLRQAQPLASRYRAWRQRQEAEERDRARARGAAVANAAQAQ